MPFMATIWASHRYYLGVIGRHESGARYAAIGLNPVTDIYDAENDLHVVVANVLKWLNQGDLDDQTQIVLRDSSDSFADIALREWIDEISGDAASYNNFFACMNEDFDSCITDDTDIIVVYPGLGRDETGPEVRARLQQALEDGVGVFYIREEINGFQAEIHDLLHIENITAQQIPQTVNGENSVNHVYSYTPFNIVVIRSALSKIINDDWDYDLSVCSGPYECEENEEANQAIILLRNALSGIRGEIVAAGIDPFETHEVNPFRRGLLLVGDYYRDLISYPMPKDSTPSRDFIRAFFGELALVLNRDSNPVARDLGTYSRTDFADNLRGNQSLSVTSQIPFTTSGFYAIPGETVTITRTDTAEARVSIRVQSLDNEQSLPFREIDGVTYDRPVFVSSTEVSIEPGETIRLNSPYGGPIHIYSKENNRNLSFEFENVGTHPVWRSASDNDAFLLALASDNYDWVEMVTPSFEILSSKEKMEELLERPRYRNNPQRLADDLQLYMNDWPLWYEGFQGGMIQDNPLMDDHPITSSDYPAQEQAARQHLIMDRMTCTDGCIGNPYVIDWAVDPFAQQDQLLTFKEFYTYGTENRALADFARRRQLFFQGSTGVSASNLSYLHTHFRQFQASGDLLIECPTLPHETLYTLVQDAFQSPSAADFIEGDALTGLEEQTALFFQIMAALENQGVYESGWDLWPLFNHYERRWTRGGETWGGHAWDDGIALGYGNTSLRDVNQNIGYNSWMLLAISWITERDFTDYLQMWGFEFSEFGLEKVAGFGFEKIEPVFYAIPPTGHCTSLDYPELPVDGVSTWPN